ncbi:MAG TPA: DUF2459 domain-containing protein [Acetobacteraceae bacterium]|nr:DUF2459 domain-containing protein [Acetobacteraceae bacterium]
MRRLPPVLVVALTFALAGCAAVIAPFPSGPATHAIGIAERSWHTDLCVAAPTRPDDPLAPFAVGFVGARFLCFGFGERQYLLGGDHGVLEMLSALLPSQSALLMTVLSAPPDAAFGAENVVTLRVPAASEAAVRGFIRDSVRLDADGRPVRLQGGPYPGSVFFAGTGTYDAVRTCNTWTADGLAAAGLSVGGPVLFAGQVMSQVRQIAARQGG